MNLLFSFARFVKSTYNVLRAVVGIVSLGQTIYRFTCATGRRKHQEPSWKSQQYAA